MISKILHILIYIFIKSNITNCVKIDIAMGIDENYIYPALVSITSAIINKDFKTELEYHILIPIGFSTRNKNILISTIENQKNIKINFYDVKNSNNPKDYKLYITEICQNIDIILYIDADTLILKDLSQILKLNIYNKYLIGYEDVNIIENQKNYSSNKYICTGVLLMNLKLMKKNKIFSKILQINKQSNGIYDEQQLLNTACYGKIGYLSPKISTWNMPDSDTIKNVFRAKISKNLLDPSKLIEAIDDTIILHFASGLKPWILDLQYYQKKLNRYQYPLLWYIYANKTKYFQEIFNKYYKEGIGSYKKNMKHEINQREEVDKSLLDKFCKEIKMNLNISSNFSYIQNYYYNNTHDYRNIIIIILGLILCNLFLIVYLKSSNANIIESENEQNDEKGYKLILRNK